MNNIFKEQIKEDIDLLKEKLTWNSNIGKDEYTFNYWILSNIYSLDEEMCHTNITEYNDKGIDCFVDYEEDKELHIIQNKYYDDKTPLNSREVSDFLTRPLATLKEGKYTKSPELQKIYFRIKEDSDYTIFLDFYVSNDKSSEDIGTVINDFNKDKESSNVFARIFFLKDIKEKYYGEPFSGKHPDLKTTLEVKNKATYLAIRPDEYKLPNMLEAYYVMAKVTDVYNLWKSADEKGYPLFEQNIREYLGGTSGINKKIISTLKNSDERDKFFYYNNGITIICDKAKADSKKVYITNPQVVNGCQTVNSIAEVLKTFEESEEDFSNVYVMVKILILEKEDKDFYRDIVKYTNSQNSINEKIFGATLDPFFTIQEKLKEYGLLLCVKQSDRFQFKDKYKDKKGKLFCTLLETANKFSKKKLFEFKKLVDLQIPLETLIQIIGSYVKDAYFAYTKKSYLLKPTSKHYQDFSRKIESILTIESMAKLVLLYKRSEKTKKESNDKRSPSPYYLLNFIGFYLRKNGKNGKNDIDLLQKFLKSIEVDDLDFVYEKFEILSKKYMEAINLEYGQIIKKKVDEKLMGSTLDAHILNLKEYNKEEYEQLIRIFEKIKV